MTKMTPERIAEMLENACTEFSDRDEMDDAVAWLRRLECRIVTNEHQTLQVYIEKEPDE